MPRRPGRDARLHNQARAFSLHQACYELRILCSYTAHGQPVDFLFVERGRRLSAFRLRAGLDQAVTAAALTGRAGQPLRVTPHQLRHTYGTTLVNAGMSLQALMALMGHVSAEMTLRYALLASPTVRAAYEAAMNKVHARQSLFVITKGRPTAPERVEWLRSEMLKPESPTATAPETSSPKPAPTPTSANNATTTSPPPNSSRPSKPNWPT